MFSQDNSTYLMHVICDRLPRIKYKFARDARKLRTIERSVEIVWLKNPRTTTMILTRTRRSDGQTDKHSLQTQTHARTQDDERSGAMPRKTRDHRTTNENLLYAFGVCNFTAS